MKCVLSLFLIGILFSTAETLQCMHSSVENRRVLRPCEADDICATYAVQGFLETLGLVQFVIRTCMPTLVCSQYDQIYSSSAFNRRGAAVLRCCDTDGCNNKTLPYPDIDVKNGLQCLTCDHPLSPVCNETLECVGAQDHCFSIDVKDKGKTYRHRGCASTTLCEIPSHLRVQTPLINNFNFSSLPKCCGTSFCNSAWTIRLSVEPLLLGLISLIAL